MDSTHTDLDVDSAQTPVNEDRLLESKVCEIVSDVLGLDSTVTSEQTLKSLGADSIDIATLIVTLQDEFPSENTLEESMMANVQTPAEITLLVKSLTGS